MKSLPEDVVEDILKRLPGKSLLRFKSVSKKWKSTIESRCFRERQLIHSRDHPEVLLVHLVSGESEQALELESSPPTVKISVANPWCSFVSQTSCDGLLCVFDTMSSNMVVNPTTRWRRCFPLSSFQRIVRKFCIFTSIDLGCQFILTGFGKDILRGTYKPLCLYNDTTTCEVFDFSSNAWRFVIPSSPHRIISYEKPLYFDGSLHWFTEGEETNVLAFDLHTETFKLIAKAPFVGVHLRDMVMLSLNNRLCVSQKKQLQQVIWSFDSENKKWTELYSIDLNITSSWFGMHRFALSALPTTTTGNKNKLLLYTHAKHEDKEQLVLHDPKANSYDLVFTAKSIGSPLSYFQSLISIP